MITGQASVTRSFVAYICVYRKRDSVRQTMTTASCLAEITVLGALAGNVFDAEFARDDLLQHLLGDGPIPEQVVRDAVGLAVGSQIVVLLVLDEKNIGVTGGRHVRDTVTGKEERRTVLELTVRSDRERLVVTEMVVRVTVDQLPCLALLFGVGELDFVRDDVDFVGVLLANEVGENGANDGGHTGGNDDDGDVVGLGEGVELLETRVEGDIATNELLHLLEGTVDRLDHLLETFTVGNALLDDFDVDLATLGVTHTDSVDHVVVRVLQCDENKKKQRAGRLSVFPIRERLCKFGVVGFNLRGE